MLLAPLVALPLCSLFGVLGIGLPRDASTHGKLIDEVLEFSHLTDAAMLGLVLVGIVFAVLRYGRKHSAVYDKGERGAQKLRTVTLVALVVLGVDGGLLYSSEKGLRDIFWNFGIPAGDPETVRIEINAHQWAWDVRYAGVDTLFATPARASADDIVVWNEVWVPVNTPVHVQLTSTDVVHGFSLPNFRVKVDAVPGTVNQLWFEARETGVFEFGCTQHCGTNHYKMRGLLHVLPMTEFREWEKRMGRLGELGFDAEDVNARWGWDWKQ